MLPNEVDRHTMHAAPPVSRRLNAAACVRRKQEEQVAPMRDHGTQCESPVDRFHENTRQYSTLKGVHACNDRASLCAGPPAIDRDDEFSKLFKALQSCTANISASPHLSGSYPDFVVNHFLLQQHGRACPVHPCNNILSRPQKSWKARMIICTADVSGARWGCALFQGPTVWSARRVEL